MHAVQTMLLSFKLFTQFLQSSSTASQHYKLRRRMHALSLPEHGTYLSDCNFVIRMLYKHSY